MSWIGVWDCVFGCEGIGTGCAGRPLCDTFAFCSKYTDAVVPCISVGISSAGVGW